MLAVVTSDWLELDSVFNKACRFILSLLGTFSIPLDDDEVASAAGLFEYENP